MRGDRCSTAPSDQLTGSGLFIRTEKVIKWIFCVAVFVFFSIWFFRIHPLQIFDTDDWKYACYHREALPIWGNWNPTRVLPEVLMPIASMFGAYVIYPIFGDFFGSFSMAYSFTVSAVVTVLTVSMRKYLLSKTCTPNTANLLTAFFLVCHFWAMRSESGFNRYMLLSANATTVFYYVIPNMLCTVWLLWTSRTSMLCHDAAKRSNTVVGAYVVLTYFCLLSNLWSSIIIGAYVGSVLLADLIRRLGRKKFSVRSYVSDHRYQLLVLLLWVLVQIFELYGGRAGDFQNGSFLNGIHAVFVSLYYEDLPFINHAFLVSTILITILGGVLMIQYSKDNCREIEIWILSLLISTAYLVLSCAKTGAGYITRPDVLYVLFVYYMMIVLCCTHSIINYFPRIKSILPLLLIIAAVECNTGEKTYRESCVLQEEPEVVKHISEDILQQFKVADQEGKDHIILTVPGFNAQTNDNFPLGTYAGQRFSDLLYLYGAVDKHITVTAVIPTDEKNVEFGLERFAE